MKNLKIKICGLTTEDTLDAALEAGVDMVGLVFFPKSPRHISLMDACRLADRARGKTEIVALTVNMDPGGLSRIRELVNPDWFQFHGDETPEFCAIIKGMLDIKVMKALGISDMQDLEQIHTYQSVVDQFLFDAKPPKDAPVPGGNGVPYDWSLLRGLDIEKPFMLSGGLNSDNVAAAIKESGATEIDVSSGVEREKGVKDCELISAFVAAARSAYVSGE